MKYLPTNTLAYFNAAPQVRRHDLSEIPTAVFGAATKKYADSCGLEAPNDEAMTFYALNHCASYVRRSFTPNEPLPPWAREVMTQYMDTCVKQGKRMLHYILAITTREMRHLPSSMESSRWQYMTKHFGGPVTTFIKSLRQYQNEDAAMARYKDHAPDAPIGKYLKGLSYAFHNGPWSGSFGGPKWGAVTDAAVAMMHGVTSMEMLVDTGYTLAHNNGPIFNKGMMYSMYSKDALLTLLDVQRSGQVPDFILDPGVVATKVPLAKAMVQVIAEHAPEEFKGWVDWITVDAMRPEPDKIAHPIKYATLIAKQKKAHPAPVAPKVKLEKVLHGKKVVYTGEWFVAPGEAVKTYERVGGVS